MTISFRSASLAVSALAAVALAATHGSSSAAQAAGNLTFTLTARVSYKDGASTPAQLIDAQVWLSGRKARMDTTLSGRPMRLLFTPPFAYRLLPAAKVGRKFAAKSLPPVGGVLPGSQGFSADPAAIRAALVEGGARKTGSAVVGGVPVDVYTAARFRDRPDHVRALLRRSDALPVRIEIDSKNFSAVASWRNYQRPATLSASLFAVPAGFKIREGAPGDF